MNFDIVKADAVGRWDGIFSSFGVQVGDGRHTACPVCGGKDRFRFDNKQGKGTWFCSQCDPSSGDGWALIQKVLGVDFKEAVEEVGKVIGSVESSNIPKKENSISPDVLRKIFIESEEAKESNLVGLYLKNRGLNTVPPSLRFTRKCYEPETKKNQRAMLAVFTLPDGEAVTMHRTYLSQDGDKLNIEKPKKILPPIKKMKGGAVRLFEDESKNIIAVTEGIETAIAVKQETHLPTWATLSSTLLESFEPPKGITHVAIFADNDRNYAGQKAAYVLANKLVVQRKIAVDVYIPECPGDDWLDDMIRRKNK